MTPSDFRWHVANQQPPGTSDTSRFATDHINNPNAINTIFNLAFRPTAAEKMRDGSTRQVNHILKDGADSVGVAGASLRVYVNIGMCGDYSMTLHDPIYGVKRAQQPFDMDHARARLRGLAEHRSADAGRRGVSENARAAAPGRRSGRRGLPDRQPGGAAAGEDRLCRHVCVVPFEQAAAGGNGRYGALVSRVGARRRISSPTISSRTTGAIR